MNITNEEMEMLERVQTEDEWHTACTIVKRARGGSYPPDWWPRVKLSGLMDRVFARFGATTELKISSIDISNLTN